MNIDSHSYGMQMPGRNESGSDDYRYGFNGMEMDDEVKSIKGSSYDFGARMYDPRVGRWLTIDPLEAKYPNQSPYNFAGNSPLMFKDPDGKDVIVSVTKDKKGEWQIKLSTKVYLTGNGVTEGYIKELNKYTKQLLENPMRYVDNEMDENGVLEKTTVYNVSFEIEYVNTTVSGADNPMIIDLINADKTNEIRPFLDSEKTEEQKSADPDLYTESGSNTLKVFSSKVDRSVAKLESDMAFIFAQPQGVLNPDMMQAWTSVHELLHLIGLIDRYEDVPVGVGETSVHHEGYFMDVMALASFLGDGEPMSVFSASHVKDIGKFFVNIAKTKGDNFVYTGGQIDVKTVSAPSKSAIKAAKTISGLKSGEKKPADDE